MRDASGNLLVEAAGKYVPVPPDRNRSFIQTLVPEPQTERTLRTVKCGTAALGCVSDVAQPPSAVFRRQAEI